MNGLSRRFSELACKQQALATNPKTLALAFCFAAVACPFSESAAVGAAIAPTLLAGSALITKGAAKVAGILGRPS